MKAFGPSPDSVQVAPERLARGSDEVARLLRAEIAAPDPPGRLDFESVRERRSRRHSRTQVWLVAATALGGAALVGSLANGGAELAPADLTVTADEWRAESPSDGATRREKPATAARPPEDVRENPNTSTRAQRDVKAVPPPNVSERDEGKTNPTAPVEVDCSAVVRADGYEAGASCFAERATRTDGVSAEVALVEKARLLSRALGRPAEALATLESYAKRFPSGTLAKEATLSRIELLAAVGRKKEALVAIHDAAPRIPERASALHLLGARLAGETGDCALAQHHLTRARAAGAPAERTSALEETSPCGK